MARPRSNDYVCGTRRAYQAHVRRLQLIDEACRQANCDYQKNRRDANARQPPPKMFDLEDTDEV